MVPPAPFLPQPTLTLQETIFTAAFQQELPHLTTAGEPGQAATRASVRGILRSFEAAARTTHYSDPGLAAVMELSAESVKSGGWVQHTGLLGWYVGKGVIHTRLCVP